MRASGPAATSNTRRGMKMAATVAPRPATRSSRHPTKTLACYTVTTVTVPGVACPPRMLIPDQGAERHVPFAAQRHRAVAERRVDHHPAGEPVCHSALREQRLRPRPDPRPFESYRHHHPVVVRGRQVQRALEQGVAEMRVLELDPHLEPCGADAIVVRIVHVKDEVERAAGEPEPGDLDPLELELGLREGQPGEGGAGEKKDGKGREETVRD